MINIENVDEKQIKHEPTKTFIGSCWFNPEQFRHILKKALRFC